MKTKGQSEETLGKQRQQRHSVLFWVFSISAIPLTVLVVILAAGYRFDGNTRSLVPSAAIMVETIPAEVTISLNEDVTSTKTPFVRKLEPGNYRVLLEAPGYHSWEKQLVFKETKSLIFPRVVLFPETTPSLIEKTKVESTHNLISSLPENLKETYQAAGWDDTSELQLLAGPADLIIDTKQSVAFIIEDAKDFSITGRFSAKIHDAEWNDNRVLLYVTDNELWIYDHRTEQHTLLQRQSTPILDATWHPGGGYIFFSDANGLSAIELDDRDHRQIWHLSTTPSPTDLNVNAKGNTLTFASDNLGYSLPLEY
ncbi:MAG: hypothetical protein COW24_05780 [Candidatus Kerfeldbacteria bacterium CG15_BIG_FIL_POST_REV_8_21_14_020_45_12]|uniref:PEGA domain-containing protein n=1 Tax=Candidatus Kerfeldbacteria bacterium CG15_BIG_FIL_POST_REV_8_21_14_020_45_12 TaxID=2014247 RepID=A0A2M7H282_9BACT|nr:MAG: hypothetical protein COW24_05780 [Candidatus Kerfeldbacteria bacterium CG15_BIG_FIL_POST_REV_8_21_14_020_45_12]PJA93737.1 MAG: hypothetical protein CO132_01705 [Candidatus Kerfeldbacteria bacterium CG_4_9_14_3_um_filter_45_8]